MAWRSMVSDVDTVKAYKDAIIGFELQDNPKQFPIEDMQDWLNFRIGRQIPITKGRSYNEWDK